MPGLASPHVGKVLQGAPVGKDVEEAQELPVNPIGGRHDTSQKCGTRPVGIEVINPIFDFTMANSMDTT